MKFINKSALAVLAVILFHSYLAIAQDSGKKTEIDTSSLPHIYFPPGAADQLLKQMQKQIEEQEKSRPDYADYKKAKDKGPAALAIYEDGYKNLQVAYDEEAHQRLPDGMGRPPEFWYVLGKAEAANQLAGASLGRPSVETDIPAISRFPYQTSESHLLHFTSSEEMSHAHLDPTKTPFVIYQIGNYPILHFRFSDSVMKGLATDRLYMFAEVKTGQVLKNHEVDDLGRKIGLKADPSGGSDFRASDVAKFFTLAERKGVQLNSLEKRMRDELINSGLLKKETSGFTAAKEFAVLATTDSEIRENYTAAIEHENNHGIYFTDANYRQAAKKLWDSLSQQDQQLAKKLMSMCDTYDFAHNEDLLIREFIAYFRDPSDFILFYLKPRGVDSASISRVQKLAELVHGIDRESHVYASYPSIASQGTQSAR